MRPVADDPDAAWEPVLDDLGGRRDAARAMGGPERLARQRDGGRLDARARVAGLVDEGSFREIGTLVGSEPDATGRSAPSDAFVAGFGAIVGGPVVVGAEDFTVMGGSIGIGSHAKRQRLVELARRERCPLVLLLDGGGERMQNSLERYPRAPGDLGELVAVSGLVPTVAVVMGPSAGHGALAAPLADFVVMVEGASLFSAGPPLVAAATGEQVTVTDLGGTDVHVARSGVAHNRAPDDEAALALVRRYLGFFPPNAWARPAWRDSGDTEARPLGGIVDVVPVEHRHGYDMAEVLGMLVDGGELLEVQPEWGPSMICGLARLGGWPVGIVANQPAVKAGAIDGPAADKAARFLEVVGSFHLPVVFVADNPGVLAGTAAEADGVLRRAARVYAAQARLTSPKLHVTIRKAYGFGSSLMAMNPFDGQTLTLALPGVRLGAMPAEGGGRVSRAEQEEQERLDAAELAGGYRAADRLSYDEMIEPAELRNALLDGLRLAEHRLRGPAEPVARVGILP